MHVWCYVRLGLAFVGGVGDTNVSDAYTDDFHVVPFLIDGLQEFHFSLALKNDCPVRVVTLTSQQI